MDARDQEVIRKMYVRLDRNLEATPLLSYLYQENVLSDEDMEKIQNKNTRKNKAEKLIKILRRRKNGLKMLIKALLMTKVQAFLAHELLAIVSWNEEEIKNIKLELEDKINPTEKLELELTVLQQKYNQLEVKHEQMKSEYKHDIAVLNQKLNRAQIELEETSINLTESKGVFSWFRKSSRHKNERKE